MIKVFGLKNCDTCRKALKWLAAENISHEFSDLRGDEPMIGEQVGQAMKEVGADTLVNRRGSTWRQLNLADKEKTGSALVALIEQQPALMKRPVFFDDAGYFVGFDSTAQDRLRRGQ